MAAHQPEGKRITQPCGRAVCSVPFLPQLILTGSLSPGKIACSLPPFFHRLGHLQPTRRGAMGRPTRQLHSAFPQADRLGFSRVYESVIRPITARFVTAQLRSRAEQMKYSATKNPPCHPNILDYYKPCRILQLHLRATTANRSSSLHYVLCK